VFKSASSGVTGVLVLLSSAFAQSTYGTLVGTVTDPTGSILPNCVVNAVSSSPDKPFASMRA
jgi:hypothetical protein